LAVAALLSGTVFPLISASPPAGASQISDLQAKASQLQQQISSESQQIGVLGERYDHAEDQINTLNAEIANTRDQISTDQKRVVGDQDNLRTVAINSYIGDGSVELSNPLFATNQKTFAAQQEYDQVATGNLGVAVANLHTAEVQLDAAEANLDTQDNQAHGDANAAASAEATANQQEAALNADLGQVKGQLGTLVAQAEQAAQNAENAQTQRVLVDGATFPPPPSAGGAAAAAVEAAESQLGVPYVWGGTSPRGTPGDPSGGFDCSGLVMWAWAQAGVDLPHFSGSQFDDTAPVPVAAMEPGDILFYGAGGSEHEAMYVGGGEMIEAPDAGDVVHITPIRLGGGFAGVGRP
jgi:cell wall-associated NlpC family hydrolase